MATHTPTFFAIVRDVILPNWLLIRPCLSHDNITQPFTKNKKKTLNPEKLCGDLLQKIVKNNQPSSSSNLPVAPGWNRTPAGLLLLFTGRQNHHTLQQKTPSTSPNNPQLVKHRHTLTHTDTLEYPTRKEKDGDNQR
jgi:hypothetical protein